MKLLLDTHIMLWAMLYLVSGSDRSN